MEQTPPPVKKYKTFTFGTSLEWSGDRQGTARSEGKPDIAVSSPPEFKGIPGVWSPEDFFVSSVEQCTMTTFLAFGLRKGIPLKSYRSTAEGTLEFAEGGYRFTRIVLRPAVTVGPEWTAAQVEELFHQAHDGCLIAASMRTEVVIEPVITIA